MHVGCVSAKPRGISVPPQNRLAGENASDALSSVSCFRVLNVFFRVIFKPRRKRFIYISYSEKVVYAEYRYSNKPTADYF